MREQVILRAGIQDVVPAKSTMVEPDLDGREARRRTRTHTQHTQPACLCTLITCAHGVRSTHTPMCSETEVLARQSHSVGLVEDGKADCGSSVYWVGTYSVLLVPQIRPPRLRIPLEGKITYLGGGVSARPGMKMEPQLNGA